MSSNRSLIHKGKLITLHREPVKTRNNKTQFFDIVKHPGGAVVAASNEKGEYCPIKQWRHAVNQFIWEFPAGCLEPNETSLFTAKRELQEETGYLAEDWHSLGSIVSTPGFCNEQLHLFEAKTLTLTKRQLDDAEQIEVHWLTKETLRDKIHQHEIIDAKTLALCLKLRIA